MTAFRQVKTTGNPWNAVATGAAGSSTTAISVPGLTTTVGNTMVVAIASTARDADSTAEFAGWTNASLVSATEGIDAVSSAGNGGGFGMAYGVKTAAGLVSATTATSANADRHAYMSIALRVAT
jgi:hypothetical protein